MTREEQLNQAAEDYRNFRESCGVNNPIMLNEIEEAYYQGINWGDKNPRKGLVDIEKVCDYLKNLGYQRYPGASFERIIEIAKHYDDGYQDAVEKAIEHIKNHWDDILVYDCNQFGVYTFNMKQTLDNFRKAMEEQQ